MRAREMRDMTEKELHKKLAEYNQEKFKLRFQHATGQLENTQRIPTVKKNIARILTILRQKEMEQVNE
ncbi:50S ribosomal protein L29 [Desulfovermiculus halophilus]|jgi:large subunit ribosomal protein L29|uniref:50S ribosomal protein L29 n=1 Tax=Desulfovermiculus halophilus TaxID=339722 RepID=UPI0004853882|nr:50S ribosomal protein L29 [Desulfovermiculus halophilus]